MTARKLKILIWFEFIAYVVFLFDMWNQNKSLTFSFKALFKERVEAICFIENGSQPPNLMPDDLRWSWCNNNRNKVQNKYNALASLQSSTPCHPPSHPPVCGKIVSFMKSIPGAKKVGNSCYRIILHSEWSLSE